MKRTNRAIASPRARRALARLGIDPRTLLGSGPGGRIEEKDVLSASREISSGTVASAKRIIASPRARRALAKHGLDPRTVTGSGPGGRIVERDVLASAARRPLSSGKPLSSMRRTIARRLVESKQTIPHFYVQRTIRADALIAFLVEAKKQGKVSVNDLVVKAVADALREFPALRNRMEGDSIIESEGCHVGVAVGLDDGLVVPAILDADKLSLHELAAEGRRIVALARERRIENAGRSLFTVSNLGMFGVEEFTAIINPPESGILAVGALRDEVIAVDGRPQVGKVMGVTLSCDHRVVDGMAAAKFLERIAAALETPAQYLGGTRTPKIQVGGGGADYDVAVVGGGPGGYVAALEAASSGAKVLLVEKSANLGGTCLNYGCIPSKALLASASLLHAIRHASEMGVRVGGAVEPDWTAIQARKDKIVSSLRGGIRGLFKSRGVTAETASARVEGHGLLALEHGGKTRTVTAGAIILATGTVPSILPGFTVDGERVATTDEALYWKTLPTSLLIVGGGVISVEFACMMAALGVKVTIVEKLPRLLPNLDDEISKTLHAILEKRGIIIHCGTGLSDFKATEQGCMGIMENGQQVKADRTLLAVGRKPVAESLGLQSLGVEFDRGFVRVNDSLEAVPGIFCVGDANGRALLAHAASAQGRVAAKAALGKPATFREPIPNAVYTFPEIGSVGLSESAALTQGLPLAIGKFPFRNLGKAMAIGETDGFVKVIRHKETSELLGVHAIGHSAVEFISSAQPLLRTKASARDLGSLVYAHPSMSEAMSEAAEDAFGEAIHLPARQVAST